MTNTIRDILALPYEDLTLSERVNAIERARIAGREAAADADRGSAGGIEQIDAPASAYFYTVVEDAWNGERINDDVCNRWRNGEFDADPRRETFNAAWAESMRDAMEDVD